MTSKQMDKPCPKCKGPLLLTMGGFLPFVVCEGCGWHALCLNFGQEATGAQAPSEGDR